MKVFGGRSLKARLVMTGVLLSLIPAVVTVGLLVWQGHQSQGIASDRSSEMAYASVDAVTQNLESMVETQHAMLEQTLAGWQNLARAELQALGPTRLGDQQLTWQAVNQYTGDKRQVKLPNLLLGGTSLEPIQTFDQAAPVVDRVRDLVGGTATIFQRLNVEGDMLRVASCVEKLNGERAVGTYIPAMNPDGSPNPVVSTLLRGETYRGRAFVVNAWYLTVYEPFTDGGGEVIGALYTGIKLDSLKHLRETISTFRVGETGAVFVLNTKGKDAGKYVISGDGSLDGQVAIAETDAAGFAYIKAICDSAVQLESGEMGDLVYQWADADGEPQPRVARFLYYPAWDWVIGVSAYESELHAARNEFQAALAKIAHTGVMLSLVVAGILVALCSGIWLIIGRQIGSRIQNVSQQVQVASSQVGTGAGQLSRTSTGLADSSTEQAAALEQSSSSLEQLTAMTAENAQRAGDVGQHMQSTRSAVSKTRDAMGRLSTAMSEIKEAAKQTAAINRTIGDIAFQTNLLALNAAVEAARAGAAGGGFAVVAEEVRALAQRTSQAARQAAELIEESNTRADRGVSVTEESSEGLVSIDRATGAIDELISQIVGSIKQQHQGIEEINGAMAQMQEQTQTIAANAEESSAASTELDSQAVQLQEQVRHLQALVEGQGGGEEGGVGPAETARHAARTRGQAIHRSSAASGMAPAAGRSGVVAPPQRRDLVEV